MIAIISFNVLCFDQRFVCNVCILSDLSWKLNANSVRTKPVEATMKNPSSTSIFPIFTVVPVKLQIITNKSKQYCGAKRQNAYSPIKTNHQPKRTYGYWPCLTANCRLSAKEQGTTAKKAAMPEKGKKVRDNPISSIFHGHRTTVIFSIELNNIFCLSDGWRFALSANPVWIAANYWITERCKMSQLICCN